MANRLVEERPGFVVGLDLGQANDFTAATVLDRVLQFELDWREREPLNHTRKFSYEVPHLQRFRLGTSYPDIVAAIGKLMASLPQRKARPKLIVDATGVGRPIVDMFSKARLSPVAVTITGGTNETSSSDFDHNVPKRNLVGALQVVMQSGRLKIARGLPEADVLVSELANFKVKISASGHDSYEAWRESVHDDLVLSASIAVWFAERMLRFTSRIEPLRI
jgi:hypothetical protein